MTSLQHTPPRPRSVSRTPRYPCCLGIALAAAALAAGCHQEAAATAGEVAPSFDAGAPVTTPTTPTASPSSPKPAASTLTLPPEMLGGIAPMPYAPGDSAGR